MEITYLGKNNFKLKTKRGTVTLESDKLTMSHKNGGEDFYITAPGEYEVEGISVFGYKTEETTAYVIQAEEVRVLFVDRLSKPLSEKNLSELENVDVAIVPVEGGETKTVIEVLTKLEPYYVLPFKDGAKKFVQDYDHGSRSVKSLSLSKLALPEDLTEVIVFE